ncbi:glycosyltransferase family 2 protein [Vibrio sp. 10N.261.55.A7]|uniref:glycosyltransferase family 2 protein n=1 Tax=Vibrio sp. 10N.261.55.A7 TaxID=1880851 RepID=UPI000C853BFC|nr:glycosyltransferase family 2 protein [Vibrio sp. 10N.261.55.A7]PMJ89853.1 glycosyl transferase [Vibrio sp. 10N.261.55.A7]
MIESMIILALVTSAALIVYHHVGYPLVLKWYAKRHPQSKMSDLKRGYRNSNLDRVRPSITILVAAYNEERWIAEKIRNLASLDYPRNRLTIIIACDGCTDNTVEIAQDTIQESICSDVHFEIRDLDKNQGKVAVINQQMRTISTDITALSDVSTLISIDALLVAEQNFKDKRTGVVNGRYQLLETRNAGEASYWQYQSQLKRNEASLGSTLGAHGAFYLFRTHLFTPLDSNTINDDFVLPMLIVKQGYNAIYDDKMVAVELEPTSQVNDFKRRLRISAGNMQQAIKLFSLFNPKYRGVAFAFFSGKGLRLTMPYLMLVCLIASIMLMDNPLFLAALIAQLSVYALSSLSLLFPTILNCKPCKLISYLVAGHFANFVGGMRYLLGLESGRWTRVNH